MDPRNDAHGRLRAALDELRDHFREGSQGYLRLVEAYRAHTDLLKLDFERAQRNSSGTTGPRSSRVEHPAGSEELTTRREAAGSTPVGGRPDGADEIDGAAWLAEHLAERRGEDG